VRLQSLLVIGTVKPRLAGFMSVSEGARGVATTWRPAIRAVVAKLCADRLKGMRKRAMS
jgi:hypothetical protein